MPRAIDAIFAAVAMLLLAVLMALIALCVVLSMGRPIFFRQTRVGMGLVPFQLIKFRSMNDRRDADGRLLPDSVRMTMFGHALRRSRLDELTELWNIMRGDMAFVGPRPLLLDTIAALGAAGIERSSVRPGLTGLAQVSGNTLLEIGEKLAMDLFYVRNRRPGLDLRILLSTPVMMVRGEKVNAVVLEKAHACSDRGLR